MAIRDTDSDRNRLSAPAVQLYGAYARRDLTDAADILEEHPEAREELLGWGLIADDSEHPDVPVVRNPQQAMQRRLEQELQAAQKRVALMAKLPDLSKELDRHYQPIQLRAGKGSVYLDDQAVVNARLQDVVGGARREILAAQPGGPRDRDVLEMAVARDAAALSRGVALRTIYRDTVRDHPVTAEYARTMSARDEGHPAQYRTLVGAFERMIIVDRETAFVSDHIVAGSPAHSAWLVTDPAVVAVLAKVFESKWMHGQPWTGELRVRRGQDPVDTVTGGDGMRTTPRQREILRNLATGVSQASIARRIGISKRTLEEQITVMKRLWGARTLSELVYQWALSPDRLADDCAPTADGRGETEDTAA